MKIETLPTSSLKPYKNNAKIHTPEQIEQIKKSIREFGFNDPIAIDENNMIIEGHGRLLALQELGWQVVDCIRLTGMTEEQKKAYIHVHNQLTMNTGFDMELLEQELKSIQGIDMSDFGFNLDFEIDSDFNFDDGAQEQEDLETTAAKKDPRTKPGQLWKLGRHRLLVGDSTNPDDVKRLTDGQAMDLCVTDPPYNVDYHGGDGKTIENDNMDDDSFYAFMLAVYTNMLDALKPGGAYYIFHSDTGGNTFRAALLEAGGQLKQVLIWVKNSLVLGRQDYQWKHEPILYGWKEGAGHYFVNDRCQTTTFESIAAPEDMNRDELITYAHFLLKQLEGTVLRENRPTKSDLHPTMKPVALCARLIQNSSHRKDKVLDLFGGSGSTLMACEQTGRDCYMMELDTKYADVILSRWEDATGQEAELID